MLTNVDHGRARTIHSCYLRHCATIAGTQGRRCLCHLCDDGLLGSQLPVGDQAVGEKWMRRNYSVEGDLRCGRVQWKVRESESVSARCLLVKEYADSAHGSPTGR